MNAMFERSPLNGENLYPDSGIQRAVKVLLPAMQVSADGLNKKLIQVTTQGQELVETSILDHRVVPDGDNDHHVVICFSSQIGCDQRCPFCASGAPQEIPGSDKKVRLIRNLSSDEIVDQVQNAIEIAGVDSDESPLLLGAMGMGEPMDNFDAVIAATSEFGKRWPNRARLTISTICRTQDVPSILSLSDRIAQGEFEIPIKMHFSLHGPDDETRRKLVPHGAPVETVLDTANAFAIRTDTDVKLNYVLVKGVNDSPEHAERLAQLISDHPIKERTVVKISEVNPWKKYTSPAQEVFDMFKEALKSRGVNVVQFSSAVDGGTVQAGCGQLQKHILQQIPL